MKRDELIRNILAAGLDSGLAGKALDARFTLAKLRTATKKDLEPHFNQIEIDRIRDRLQRKPIDEDVIRQLVEKCDWSCCVCWDLEDRQPIIIHHIEEHAKGGDDTYENLVVLCLSCHGTAHSRWDISQHPLHPKLIRSRKADFEKAIAEFKAGRRAAPGREGDGSDATSQSDVEALKHLADFLSRPAVFRPFRVEGNMMDFLAAMADISKAMNAGILRTREGDDVGRIKKVRRYSNPHWRERLDLVSQQFDSIRSRVEVAIRDKELSVDTTTGSYCFNNAMLADEIDAMRHAVVSLFNSVLRQAGIDSIRGPAQ
ncbi:MAG TPA: HNH endonuclease signature motif containing protein [Gemmataceae bacterium]|nr:HNH endonuclease signature motif containing protein [Gemmataceae bacterium]